MQLSQITAVAPEVELTGNVAVLRWPEADFAVSVEADGEVGQFTGPHSRFEAEIAVLHHIDEAVARLNG